jgi:hypothetical protein
MTSSSTVDDKNVVADDLSMRRNDSDNPNGNSRNGGGAGDDLDHDDVDGKDFGLKSNPSSLIDNIDSIPYIPDIIPDLKHDQDVQDDLSHPRHPGSDPSSPMRSRGLKRSHSPSIDPQDSESQDSYAGGGGGGSIPPQGGMMPGHPDSDFQGINEGGKKMKFVVVVVE